MIYANQCDNVIVNVCCVLVEHIEVPIEVHSQENISAPSPQSLSPTLIKQLRIISERKLTEVNKL